MGVHSEPDAPADSSGFHDIRMRGFRARTEVAAVQRLLDERLQPLSAEEVDLHHAAGRVLAEDVVAEVAVPPFDRAAMDGYAVRGTESFGASPYNPLEFEVIGTALPGQPFGGAVQPGQAVRIMTGAPLPNGADAVIPAEEIQAADATHVRATAAIPPGRHVGRRGEDVEVGMRVLTAGRVLRPQDVGVLASIGAAPVRVVRRPSVAIIVTGNELLPCGARPHGYRIVDSNSVMLEALVRRDGGVSQTAALVLDRRESIRAALETARADVLLVSGGSSVGQEDHAPGVLRELGELSVHGVALRPASPTGVGFLDGRPVFLLPGNPASCLCAYDLFGGYAVRRLGGRPVGLPYRACMLPLARKIASAVGRLDYVRVTINNGLVTPVATSGASILTSTTRAAGFVLVAGDSEGRAAGELVTVYLYDEPSGSGCEGT